MLELLMGSRENILDLDYEEEDDGIFNVWPCSISPHGVACHHQSPLESIGSQCIQCSGTPYTKLGWAVPGLQADTWPDSVGQNSRHYQSLSLCPALHGIGYKVGYGHLCSTVACMVAQSSKALRQRKGRRAGSWPPWFTCGRLRFFTTQIQKKCHSNNVSLQHPSQRLGSVQKQNN